MTAAAFSDPVVSLVMHSLRLAPLVLRLLQWVEVQSIDGLRVPLRARVLSEVVPEQESPHLHFVYE